MAKVLTPLSIQNAKPRRRGGVPVLTEISDAGCKGLRLVVHASGHRSWVVRFRYGGRSRKLTLGPAIVLRPGEADPGNGALTLASARKACTDALHRLAQGRDPAAEKLARQTPTTGESFARVAEDYFQRAKIEKDLRSGERQLADLRRLVFPTFGKLPMSSIRRSDVVKLLDSISVSSGPRMADCMLSAVAIIMRDHARRSDDFVPPLVPGMKKCDSKARARSRILDDDEIKRVWTAAGEGGVFGGFIRFLLLTAARRNEAANMPWGEIGNGNGNGSVWVLPAARNKSKQELARPLSTAAQAVLAGLASAGNADLVFQQDRYKVVSNLAPAKREFDKACGVRGWVLHDLRRTARSLMSRAGVADNVGERCLGHVIGGVRGVYDRHKYQPEMLHAYEALAALISNIVEPPGEKVVSLHRAAPKARRGKDRRGE
jgi:integrase